MRLNLTGFSAHMRGFHIGHVNGDLTHCLTSSQPVVFLINDLAGAHEDECINLVQQVSAFLGKKLHFARKSRIEQYQGIFRRAILDSISFRRLRRLSFLKTRDMDALSLAEILVPVEQIIDIFSIGASEVYSNRDNYQAIELAHECRRKLNRAPGFDIQDFRLVSGKFPYALGTDGRNMSSRNKNEVYIFDQDEVLWSSINSIRSDLAGWVSPSLANNPIFQYVEILGFNDFSGVTTAYLDGSIGDAAIKKEFFRRMVQLRASLEMRLPSRNEASGDLRAGEEFVCERIMATANAVGARMRE